MEDNIEQSLPAAGGSDNRIRAAFANIAIGFAMIDPSGRFIDANAAMCAITGYTLEEFLALDSRSLIHPEDRAENKILTNQLLSGEISDYVIENRCVRKNGEIIWVRKSVSLIRDADDNPLWAIALLEDFTVRKEAEQLSQRNLHVMTQLHKLGMLSVQEDNLETVLSEVVEAAISISGADFGFIQMLDPVSGDLQIVAQRGFPAGWNEFWNFNGHGKWLGGPALAIGERVIVEDVEKSEIFLNWPTGLEMLRNASVRAFQSTPLFSRDGKKAGIFSTHYRVPTRPDDIGLRLLDILARQSADIIEQVQSEAARRQSQEKQAFLVELGDLLRPLADPAEIEAAMTRRIGEFLDVSRVWLMIHDGNESWVVERDYAVNGTLSIAGRYSVEDYDFIFESLHRGQTLVVPDIMMEPRFYESERKSVLRLKLHAFVIVPIFSYGNMVAMLGVGETGACNWTEWQVRLIEETAERMWPDLKRAQVQQALWVSVDRRSYLLQLSDTIRPLVDPTAIQGEACQLICEHLGSDRAFYTEYYLGRDYARVYNEYQRGNSPSMVGEYRLADFGWIFPHYLADQIINIEDTNTSDLIPEAELPAMAALHITALLSVPLLKNGVLVATLTVSDSKPRQWTRNDVLLVQETAERTWAAVERARAEAKLRESEEKHRTLFEAIDEGVCLLERLPLRSDGLRDYRYITMNPAMQKMFDLPDLSGQTIRDIFSDDIEDWFDDCDQVLETGQPANLERVYRPKGMIVEMFITRVEDGTDRTLLAVLKDVTARKQREARQAYFLKLSEALKPVANPIAVAEIACQMLVDHLDASRGQYAVVRGPLGEEVGTLEGTYARRGQVLATHYSLHVYGDRPLSWLREGRVFVLNDAEKDPRLNEAELQIYLMVQSLAVVSVPLVKGNNLTALFTVHNDAPREWTTEEIALIEETAEKTWAAIERAQAEKALRQMNEELEQRVLGRTRELLASNRRLASEIAERHQIEEALRQSRDSLEETLAELRETQEHMLHQERLAVVGQLAAGVAHDFNNMLTGILSFTELLQLSQETPEHMLPILEKINLSSQRAAGLVRQLLDFSQKTVRQPRQLDLGELLYEQTAFLQRIIPENIHFMLNIGTRECLIEADPTQIEQVVTNLVVNARDAMPGGGKLEIRLDQLSLEGQDVCTICGESIAGEWLALTVVDTGHGITDEVMRHIFEPFFTTKEVGQGSGLGLSQVAGIVAQHNGHVTIESGANMGVTFGVYLPPLSVKEVSQLPEMEPVIQTGKGQRILVVEDEPTVIDAIRQTLEFLHYEVLTADNGRTALAYYRANPGQIDLVLSDMVMPDMDGETLFRTLTAEDPNLRMVLMSGYPLGDRGMKLLEAGLVAWLEKPVSFGQLSQAVDRALSHS